MADTLLTITSGLPYGKDIHVKLPANRSWWLDTAAFEVLFQIREGKSRDTPLVMDMADFLTVTQVDVDNFKIEFKMTGANTRDLKRGGSYDVIMSDPGGIDARAIVILKGPVKRLSVITAETEDAP